MLPESVPVVGESSVPASSIVHTPRVPETTVSDMDSDNRDDVPLARLLKRTLIPDVSDKLRVDPPSSIHSQESSLTKGVFIPTPSIPPASKVQPGPSSRSLPSSPLPFASDEVEPPHPDICTEEVPTNDDENLAVPPTSIDIHVAPKPAKRKSQQNRRNITTKTGNVIDVNCSPSSPSTDVLASVLFGGTLSTWSVNGITAAALSIKYAILHKIDIANWFPSSHASSVYAALGTFFYQICNDNKVDTVDAPRPDLKTLALSYRLFHGSRVPILIMICIHLVARAFSILVTGISLLKVSLLILEIDALVRHLKTFASITSRRELPTDSCNIFLFKGGVSAGCRVLS
ncbi:envelope-like protein [Cucumis melo var. makuwa]|uniref:Envelope-like protein n=1 Tax=Cucumis melo var. makuwa TaxID=1194695 RepID=A0A5A7SNB1_CUCMM|nr:envelope-like protein [Cucumis melo var. makuwa]